MKPLGDDFIKLITGGPNRTADFYAPVVAGSPG